MEQLRSRKLVAFSLCIGSDASESADILEVRVLRGTIWSSHPFIQCEVCKGAAISLQSMI